MTLPTATLPSLLADGPVTGVTDDGRVLVSPAGPGASGPADSEPVAATVALAVPYRPVPGDHVLMIRDGAAAYVIGVLAFAGDVELRFPADVRIEAGATLGLSAARVQTEAEVVETTAGRVEVTASTLWQRFHDAYTWVRDLFQRRVGRSRKVVETTDYTRAGQSVIHAERVVKIDGEQIQIG